MSTGTVIGGFVLILLGTIWILSSFFTKSSAMINVYALKASPDVILGYQLPIKPTNWRRIMGIISVFVGLCLLEYKWNYTGLIKKSKIK